MGEATFSCFSCYTYASLIPAPKDVEEAEKIKNFIAELCKWDNSLSKEYISRKPEKI